MIWIIVITIIGIAVYSFFNRNEHQNIYDNDNLPLNERHTYFDDLSDEEIEYDYMQREQEKQDEEDYYIQQMHEK